MPSVNEMIQSKYLRKEDVEDDICVTIKSVTLQDMPGDGHYETRWCMQFRELEKKLVLNTTSIKVCGAAFGKHTDQWSGQRVTLYVDPNVSFKGQVVGGLRLRPVKSSRTTAAAAEALSQDFDDALPASL